jgi:hypothetical protein
MTSCPHGNPILGQVEAPAFSRRQHAYRLDTAQPGAPVVVLTVSEVVGDEQALITLLCGKGLTPGPPGARWWSWSVGQTAAVCCL